LTSIGATLITDATPPTVLGAFGGTTNVTVRFSEKVTQASAEAAGNYTVAGLTIASAKLQANGTDVVLTTIPQTSGTSYTMILGDKEGFFSSMPRGLVFIHLIMADIGHGTLDLAHSKSLSPGSPQPMFGLRPPKWRRQGGARRFFNRRLAFSPPPLAIVPTLFD
jgi:hypothetical protein